MIKIMKKVIPLLLLSLAPLVAEPVLYEGFSSTGAAAGRTGWLTEWHRLQGEVGSIPDSIGIPGLEGSKGALLLEKKGEALAQVGVDVKGTFYGSFRVRTAELKNDSLLGLVFAKPNLEELTPKTATFSLLVKGWRMDHALLLSDGKVEKTSEGVPMEAKQAYVVLFKVENPASGPSSLTMWMLNPDQVLHFANRSLSEAVLNNVALGAESGAVMQRLTIEAKNNVKLELSKGDVVACMAKFNPKAVFDEIRLSKVSLAAALGLNNN